LATAVEHKRTVDDLSTNSSYTRLSASCRSRTRAARRHLERRASPQNGLGLSQGLPKFDSLQVRRVSGSEGGRSGTKFAAFHWL